MKRFAFLFAFLAFGGYAAHAETLEEFLKAFPEKRAGINALKAKFTQVTLLPDEMLETPGTLVYAQPRRIVMRTEEPAMTTLIDDRRAYEYDPALKQVNIYNLDETPEAEIFFLGFDNDLDRLDAAYELALFEPESQPVPTVGLSIMPRARDKAEAYFIEVRLYLDREHYLPHKIHIISEDSEIITLIGECVINPALDAAETQISLLPSTYIIENDEMVEAVGEGGKMIPEAVEVKTGESRTIKFSHPDVDVSVDAENLGAPE